MLTYTISEEGWVLQPGIGYLMHVVERVHTKKYVPIIDGKSTLARFFIKVHETAGYGDPGFNGQFTLEVTSQHRIRVYAGMRIAQVRFHTIQGELRDYSVGGTYARDAVGAVAPNPCKLFT